MSKWFVLIKSSQHVRNAYVRLDHISLFGVQVDSEVGISRQDDFNLTGEIWMDCDRQSPLKTLFAEAASPFWTFFFNGLFPTWTCKINHMDFWIQFNNVSSNLGGSWSRGEMLSRAEWAGTSLPRWVGPETLIFGLLLLYHDLISEWSTGQDGSPPFSSWSVLFLIKYIQNQPEHVQFLSLISEHLLRENLLIIVCTSETQAGVNMHTSTPAPISLCTRHWCVHVYGEGSGSSSRMWSASTRSHCYSCEWVSLNQAAAKSVFAQS